MTREDLHSNILYLYTGYSKLSNELSDALGSNSCIYKKKASKAFILRNYISILESYRLFDKSFNFAASYIVGSYNVDDFPEAIAIIVDITIDEITTQFVYSGFVDGSIIAVDIEEYYNKYSNIHIGINGNQLNIITNNTNSTTPISIVFSYEDTLGSVIEINSFIPDRSDSIAAEIELDRINCISYNSMCNIIADAYKLLETKCNC